MKSIIAIFLCFLTLNIWAQHVETSVVKNIGTLDYTKDVKVFTVKDSLPFQYELLGKTTVTGTGLSKICNWEAVIETARMEARKIGGNVLKVTMHATPDMMRSCHGIKADILYVANLDSLMTLLPKDSSLINADFALLHVYRFSGAGAMVSYDLYLGDSIICRVGNKWKRTLKIRKDGLNSLWARTEAKKEIPVDIQFGKEYYLRCSITMGVMVGHPKLELVDSVVGKAEYESIKNSKSAVIDVITMNDGKEIECSITGEDDQNFYVEVIRSGKKIKTHIQKTQIKAVEHGE